jgi:hypothetical protein
MAEGLSRERCHQHARSFGSAWRRSERLRQGHPLLDRLLTALRDGETIVFYGDASSRSGVTMMSLAERGDWGTLITTDFPVSTEASQDEP